VGAISAMTLVQFLFCSETLFFALLFTDLGDVLDDWVNEGLARCDKRKARRRAKKGRK